MPRPVQFSGAVDTGELTATEARPNGDGLTLLATTRIDRYAHGLIKRSGRRRLDLEITARVTRT